MSLQLLQDSEGNNTGVFIPYGEWSQLKKKHKDLAALEDDEPTKKDVIKNIKKGLKEVELFKKEN